MFQALLEFPADRFSYLSLPSKRVTAKLAGNSPCDVSSRIPRLEIVIEKVIFNFICVALFLEVLWEAFLRRIPGAVSVGVARHYKACANGISWSIRGARFGL